MTRRSSSGACLDDVCPLPCGCCLSMPPTTRPAVGPCSVDCRNHRGPLRAFPCGLPGLTIIESFGIIAFINAAGRGPVLQRPEDGTTQDRRSSPPHLHPPRPHLRPLRPPPPPPRRPPRPQRRATPCQPCQQPPRAPALRGAPKAVTCAVAAARTIKGGQQWRCHC